MDVLPSVRRSYLPQLQISLTWLWSTRARVTDSDQTVQRGMRTSAVLSFGLRVSRLNHSATRSLKHNSIAYGQASRLIKILPGDITFHAGKYTFCSISDEISEQKCFRSSLFVKSNFLSVYFYHTILKDFVNKPL